MIHPDDQWLICENEDGSRQYIFHAVNPVFIARIFDDTDVNPAPISGLIAAMPNGQTLAEFVWFDEPECDARILASLAHEASDAIDLYDRRLGLE